MLPAREAGRWGRVPGGSSRRPAAWRMLYRCGLRSFRHLGPVVWIVALASCSDEVSPPPREIPYVHVRLPRSARAYYSRETGMQHTMLQVRFEMASCDLATFASRLPCRLGTAREGPPEFATVGTNDRAWYAPERARRHRGCQHHRGILDASFLADLTDPARLTVYAVVALE